MQESLEREAALRRAWGERRVGGELGERGGLQESLGREEACRRVWGERLLVCVPQVFLTDDMVSLRKLSTVLVIDTVG